MLKALFSGSQHSPKALRLRHAESMSAAISRSQAMIEFDLSGRILVTGPH